MIKTQSGIMKKNNKLRESYREDQKIHQLKHRDPLKNSDKKLKKKHKIYT